MPRLFHATRFQRVLGWRGERWRSSCFLISIFERVKCSWWKVKVLECAQNVLACLHNERNFSSLSQDDFSSIILFQNFCLWFQSLWITWSESDKPNLSFISLLHLDKAFSTDFPIDDRITLDEALWWIIIYEAKLHLQFYHFNRDLRNNNNY